MEILYKRNKNGSIQQWGVESNTEGYLIKFGKLNGKIQEAFTKIEEGKQSRTREEQIQFEIQSQIRGKKDEGYKSLNDLGIAPPEYNPIKGGELENWLPDLLDKYLPKESTDSNGNYKPMLAQPIKNDKKDNWNKVKYPVAGEPKLDGVRCMIFLKDYQGGVKFTDVQSLSREGKSYDFGTTKIREALVPLFQDNGDIILDGELYVHGMPQNRISGSMRGTTYIPELHDVMEYHVYDIIKPKQPYSERRKDLENLFINYEGFKLGRSITLVDKKSVDNFEEECIEAGYEGIMLKNLDGLYEIGKRSYNNLKVKQFLDEEFKIVGYELGKRGSEDIVFLLKTKEDKEFKAKPIGNRELKAEYLKDFEADLHEVDKNRKILGKKATVKFKFWSEYGIPNHTQVISIRDYES